MPEYRKVSASFWTGDTGRFLRGSPEAQIVALYLVTGPGANWLGLYHLPIPLLAHHTGLSLEGASKGLRRAIEGGFCRYDEAREEVFVVEMASYQIGDSLGPTDKRHGAVVKEWQLAKKSLFYRDFWDRYGKPFNLPKPSPLEGASKPHRSQEQEQKQKQEQDSLSSPTATPPGDDSKNSRPRDELFDAIAEVAGADPKANGSHIGRVKKKLLEFSPPITPDEVRRFPAVLAEQGWNVAISLGVLEKQISWVRTPPAKASPKRGPPRAENSRGAAFETLAKRAANHVQPGRPAAVVSGVPVIPAGSDSGP
jgi:hypothetical protein